MITWCTACGAATQDSLCHSCRIGLVPGATTISPTGMIVSTGLIHRGPARRLVHRLKFDGDRRAAAVLVDAMQRKAPAGATGWVPVPRAKLRAMRYGVDPARLLCEFLADVTGVPVVPALASGWWWASHNRGALAALSAPVFTRLTDHASPDWVLVDDVATTMNTLESARVSLSGVVRHALVATAPLRSVSNLISTAETNL